MAKLKWRPLLLLPASMLRMEQAALAPHGTHGWPPCPGTRAGYGGPAGQAVKPGGEPALPLMQWVTLGGSLKAGGGGDLAAAHQIPKLHSLCSPGGAAPRSPAPCTVCCELGGKGGLLLVSVQLPAQPPALCPHVPICGARWGADPMRACVMSCSRASAWRLLL